VGTADEVRNGVPGKLPKLGGELTPTSPIETEAPEGTTKDGGETKRATVATTKAAAQAKRAVRGTAKNDEGRRAGRGRKRGTRRSAGSKPRRKQKGAEGDEKEHPPISRRELLEKALSIIEGDLGLAGDERPTNTISSLVQLLKLDRSLKVDDEKPHEIRIVWQETDEEIENGSAESSPAK
jgi:hypothetical protein